MTLAGWAELAVGIGCSVLAAWPMGIYLARIWAGQSTWLDPLLVPIERLFYALGGIDPRRGQTWFEYAVALLVLNAVGYLLLYAILRLQGVLPFNPQGAPGVAPDLAFDTAISFVSKTAWQSYAGETALSHFSQMAGLTVQNFVSAASGIAVAAAVARAFALNRSNTIGNFWSDVVRVVLYFLLPLSIGACVILMGLGVPQTMAARADAHTLEGARQAILLGPVASLQAINQVGSNGGPFFAAGAAHPFENPGALSNLVELIAMNSLGFACVVAFGRTVRLPTDARALMVVMILIVSAAAGLVYSAECQPAPSLVAAHVESSPNMEGKETRFGAPSSAAFAAVAVGSGTGSVNATNESFMPLSSGVLLFMMQLGGLAPGGAGSGFYGMVVMALLAVFVAGLLVGRTPEYLGKKIEAREIKFAMLASILVSASSLGLTAIGLILPGVLHRISASGPHGLTELLWDYTSAATNNGSAFAGLASNTPYLNVSLGLAMALGRYGYILPVLAICGALASKPKLSLTHGTFPTDGPLFISLLGGVIFIMGGLQFFPAQALGPIVEHLQMQAALGR